MMFSENFANMAALYLAWVGFQKASRDVFRKKLTPEEIDRTLIQIDVHLTYLEAADSYPGAAVG
jgi:hypothetical protein